ncbi:uncharacterized protein I303_103411 [Kwoniella dejecticola CBS 10117]|uniref:Uncharacterized protein n=1 Tax=Kwoniella dejecticola CBS 10117 TaxID=1296121 RepID=A0A1A6A6N5_9TREE|nr:uncharacterized protein I303_03433 [Kwoniella dejecticola CBS 10117]OBR85722.1 hypothetical protein I303_03433 [Kwoniella dejecticola CBS 10117]
MPKPRFLSSIKDKLARRSQTRRGTGDSFSGPSRATSGFSQLSASSSLSPSRLDTTPGPVTSARQFPTAPVSIHPYPYPIILDQSSPEEDPRATAPSGGYWPHAGDGSASFAHYLDKARANAQITWAEDGNFHYSANKNTPLPSNGELKQRMADYVNNHLSVARTLMPHYRSQAAEH